MCVTICKSEFLVMFVCFLLLQIGKDGEIERLTMEVSEVHKSKRQLIELMEQKNSEISEKNTTISSYLDRIVSYFLVFIILISWVMLSWLVSHNFGLNASFW